MHKLAFKALILLIVLGMLMVPGVAWLLESEMLLCFWSIPAFGAAGLYLWLNEKNWELFE